MAKRKTKMNTREFPALWSSETSALSTVNSQSENRAAAGCCGLVPMPHPGPSHGAERLASLPQAWHPAAWCSPLPWASLLFGGLRPVEPHASLQRSGCHRGSTTGPGPPTLTATPRCPPPQACRRARRGQVTRIRPSVFAYPQHRGGNEHRRDMI